METTTAKCKVGAGIMGLALLVSGFGGLSACSARKRLAVVTVHRCDGTKPDGSAVGYGGN